MNFFAAAAEEVDLEAAMRSFADKSPPPHFHNIRVERVEGHRLTQRGGPLKEEYERLACIPKRSMRLTPT